MSFFKTCLLSYSQVFFIGRAHFGLGILLLTFFNPLLGFIGLFSVIFSNLLARFLSPNSLNFHYGIYGLNGLFTGLTLGYSFVPDRQTALLLPIALFSSALLCRFLETVFRSRGLPIISLPFCLNMIFFHLAIQNFPGLNPSDGFLTPLSSFREITLLAIGQIFFLQNLLASLCLFFLVFMFSRISFFTGFFSALISIGLAFALLEDIPPFMASTIFYNSFLTGIAVTAIFFIPSISTILLSLAVSTLLVPLTSALHVLFMPWGIPVYTLPFNLLALGVLYGLKACIPEIFREFPGGTLFALGMVDC